MTTISDGLGAPAPQAQPPVPAIIKLGHNKLEPYDNKTQVNERRKVNVAMKRFCETALPKILGGMMVLGAAGLFVGFVVSLRFGSDKLKMGMALATIFGGFAGVVVGRALILRGVEKSDLYETLNNLDGAKATINHRVLWEIVKAFDQLRPQLENLTLDEEKSAAIAIARLARYAKGEIARLSHEILSISDTREIVEHQRIFGRVIEKYKESTDPQVLMFKQVFVNRKN